MGSRRGEYRTDGSSTGRGADVRVFEPGGKCDYSEAFMRGSENLLLAVFLGDGMEVHTLREGELVVGRGEGVDLRIEDASVSRRHAILRVDDHVSVRDLASANGTRLRSGHGSSSGATKQLVSVGDEPVRLSVGDAMSFGSVMAVLRREETSASARDGVVVRDPAMKSLYEQAGKAAASLLPVLLLGETGVGKDVLAKSIHARSKRPDKPFLPINCAALSPTLLDAELFGHEKGAFTGASGAHAGLFEAADGGTVFLDEVGEMPLPMQAKLLRVLEDKTVLRVGGRTPRSVDVRFISATNRDLELESSKGSFREDLYFRLSGIELTVPPLRERVSEIADLASLFLARSSALVDRRPPKLAADAQRALERYAWPGNVRELRNAIERAVVLSGGDEILLEHLPRKIAQTARVAEGAPSLQDEIASLERARFLDALEKCDGNRARAAEMLGISLRTLASRLAEWGLTRPRR